MKKFFLAFKHKFDVHFRHKTKKTKMNTTSPLFLDGSEKSMIPIIKSNAAKIDMDESLGSLVALEEFSAGTGISDLTIFTVDSKIIEKRKQSDVQPVTSKIHIEVLLALLESGPSTIKDIMSASRIGSRQTVSRCVERLMGSGLVTCENGFYTASYSLTEHTSDKIIAIEAKVRDWKSGVRQAMRYKEYADYSYLAIYEDNITGCLDNLEIFKRLGIGLIGVSDNGISVHLSATPSDMTTVENKLLAFERFISVIDERYESFVAGNGFAANHA